jgi:hypothetical protein
MQLVGRYNDREVTAAPRSTTLKNSEPNQNKSDPGRTTSFAIGSRSGLGVVARTSRFALAVVALTVVSWGLLYLVGTALRGTSHLLLVAIGAGLGLVIAGQAWGSRTALLFGMLFGVPQELPFSFELRSESSLFHRKARWLVGFLREKPRGCNTPGGHLAYGVIAIKKLLKRAALSRERRSPGLRALEERRSGLVDESRRAAHRTFRLLHHADPSAEASSRQEHELNTELARVEAELFRRRLGIQNAVVEAFREVLGNVWPAPSARGLAGDLTLRAVLGELQQPANEPPALLPGGLVRGPRAVAFEYGMFLGRIAMALLFVSTFHPSFLLVSLLLFWLELYVVEPVVSKLHFGAMNLFLEVRGHKMADCRQEIEALTVGHRTFRFPIIVPKFSSNPAATQLAAIIAAAVRRSGIEPERVTPFAMRAGNRRTVLELAAGTPAEVERRGALLRSALRAELDASRARFPLDVELEQDQRRVSLVLTNDDRTIWDLIGEDASQAFAYQWKNLRALGDSLAHLGPRFEPVFILASNSRDPDVIQYEIDQLAQLQQWSSSRYHGQVGFLYLLRGGAWYGYNPRLRRFDAHDKDFVAAFPGIEASLAAPDQPLRGLLGGAAGEASRREQLAQTLNRLLGERDLYRHFDEYDFGALPAHRQPTAGTRALLERRRAGEELPAKELLALNRELLFTALPMRGGGSFFKKVGNDIAVHELLVAGKTRPTVYTDRRIHEHVQDGGLPNYRMVWGDFARYTGLRGSNQQIHAAILAGEDLVVDSVPELAAIADDKNSFDPGEVEKALAIMLHGENRHIVMGVPRIEVTLPEDRGRTVSSPYVLVVQAAREIHNAADALTKAGTFELSSAAFGKWFLRPRAYFAHYAVEALNAAHALSHDFQQSYLVAGAAGRVGALCEALFGPSRFGVSCVVPRASREKAVAIFDQIRAEGGARA